MGPRDYIGTLRVEKELIMNLDDNYSPRCMKMSAGEVNIHHQNKISTSTDSQIEPCKGNKETSVMQFVFDQQYQDCK